jgi:hypothetical protein
MNNSVLFIDTDNCYIINYISKLNLYNYVSPVIRYGYSYLFWINDHYQECTNYNISNLKKNTYAYCYYNRLDSIPINIEILICVWNVCPINLPYDLKVFCCLIPNFNDLSKISFPIGLKYLCLWSNTDANIINKIKIPFGCKLILY